MGARFSLPIALLAAAALAGCSDQQSSNATPTEPQAKVAAKPGGCDFQAIQKAVNDEFTGSSDVDVSKLVTSMKNYAGGGDVSNATFVGYQVLDSLANSGRKQGTAAAGSTLAIALLKCMEIGGAAIPSDLSATLADTTAAFGVRGLTASDAEGLRSHDGVWDVEPPAGHTWRGITTTGAAVADSVAHILLVHGNVSSLTQPQFTNDTPLSTVYEWATIPTATFSPGIVVGQCSGDLAYIQHNPANSGGEILGFVPVDCVGSTALRIEAPPRSFAQRVGRLLSPEPAYAAVLLGGGSGGLKGSLSPFGKVYPGAVNLTLASQPSKSGNQVGKVLVDGKGNPLAVGATSNGGTPFKQATVFAWLEAVSNNGSFVQVCNNWAYSDDQGTITFTRAFLNKAGGYNVVVHTVGTDQQTSASGTPPVPAGQQPKSALFNVKNGTVADPAACQYPNAFTDPATQALPQLPH